MVYNSTRTASPLIKNQGIFFRCFNRIRYKPHNISELYSLVCLLVSEYPSYTKQLLEDRRKYMTLTDENEKALELILNTSHFLRDTEFESPLSEKTLKNYSKWYDDEKTVRQNYEHAFAAALTSPEIRALLDRSGLPAEPSSLTQLLFSQPSLELERVRDMGIDLLKQQS